MGNGHQPQGAMLGDRLAPHSVEAEESVLGSILLNPDAYHEVNDILQPEHFFIVRNAWVYEAMRSIRRRDEQIDNITVAEELRSCGRLDETGGIAYITYLINHTPSSIFTETYARIVLRASVRRKLLDAASEIAKVAYDESADIDETIADAERALYGAVSGRSKRTDAKLRDVLADHMDEIDRRRALNEDGVLTGVPSGLRDLDQLLGGFHDGNLIILAGRPGMGKTSLMLTIAMNAAKLKVPVGIMSLEMNKKRLTDRLVAMETGINSNKLRDGELDDREYAMYIEAADRLSKLPMYLDHTPAMQPDQMRSRAQRWHGEFGVKLLMLDYVGLMRSRGIDPNNRNVLITECSSRCLQVSHELEIPFMVASQLSREVEKRKDKRPVMSDLRDSGSLEQDADVILMMYRDEEYNENTEYPNQADILVRKNRDGATGVISLYFRKELTHFADLTKTNISFAGYGDTETNAVKPKPAERVSGGYPPGR